MRDAAKALYRAVVPRLNQGASRMPFPELPAGTSIPRRIHQTFPVAREGGLPDVIRDNIAAMRALNPTWTHTLYDDGDIDAFVRDRYGRAVHDAYRWIDEGYGAARADLFRYLLLYDTGGLYLDIKSTTTRPLDSVLRADDRYLISQWPTWGRWWELEHIAGGEFQQWFIAAAPGHPFLRATILRVIRNLEIYVSSAHGHGHHGTCKVTGPVAYTLAIDPLLPLHPHRRVDSEADLGLQYTILEHEQHRTLFRRGTYHRRTTSLTNRFRAAWIRRAAVRLRLRMRSP